MNHARRLCSHLFGVLALMASIMAVNSADAQEVVGTALVDGRPATLMSDGTWFYSDSADAQCDLITSNLSFCDSSNRWRKHPTTVNPAFNALYGLNGRFYSGVVYEPVGSAQGFSNAHLLDVALDTAGAAANRSKNNIPTFGLAETEFEGIPANRVGYALKIDGLEFVYLNTVAVDTNQMIQIVSWTFGTEPTDRLYAEHEDFLSRLDMKDSSE